MVVLYQCARVKEIVRHLGTVLPLFDNSLGHRAGNLREKPTDLYNRGYVVPLQLASAIPNGLVIDEILRHGFLFAARPGLILLLEAAHRLLQDGFLGREVTALDFLADKVAEVVGERDVHRSNPFWRLGNVHTRSSIPQVLRSWQNQPPPVRAGSPDPHRTRNGRADCEIWSEIAGFSIRTARLRRLRLAAWRRLDPRSRRFPSPVVAAIREKQRDILTPGRCRSKDIAAQVLVLGKRLETLTDELVVNADLLILSVGGIEADVFENALEDRVQAASADVLGRAVDQEGQVGHGLDRVAGEFQLHPFGAEQGFVLADQRSPRLAEDPGEVVAGQVVHLDANREPALELGHKVRGLGAMEGAGGHEQDVIGLDRAVLGVDRGSLDDRQQITLHALARDVRAAR